jgi:hypothetical protein
MDANVPLKSLYIFRQQGNLLHFQGLLHNVCFSFQKMPFISYFHLFLFKLVFHKSCAKIYVLTPVG